MPGQLTPPAAPEQDPHAPADLDSGPGLTLGVLSVLRRQALSEEKEKAVLSSFLQALPREPRFRTQRTTVTLLLSQGSWGMGGGTPALLSTAWAPPLLLCHPKT